MSSEEMNLLFKDLTKHEVEFLKSEGIPTNQHGVYLFESQDRTTTISLDLFLMSYKDWLIENKIVRL